MLAQFYYYLYGKNEIFLTDLHRWNFTRAVEVVYSHAHLFTDLRFFYPISSVLNIFTPKFRQTTSTTCNYPAY
jgi:hypothetical protein